MDARQADTLHAVVSTALQIIALGLILLVILGQPSPLRTFLGLAGAGLTVALKDFIVSFLGWFVLMGRNGIRLGDWVEINGLTGEVAEVGMFHTVLLETGNWTDSAHPTGRRVGHYFNFPTTARLLSDELTLVVASSQSPYPKLMPFKRPCSKPQRRTRVKRKKNGSTRRIRGCVRALSAPKARVGVKQLRASKRNTGLAVRFSTAIPA